MAFRIVFAAVLTVLIASCAPEPELPADHPRSAAPKQPAMGRIPTRFPTPFLSLKRCRLPADLSAQVLPVDRKETARSADAEEFFDEKEANPSIRKTRYSFVEYHWGRWKLLEAHDSERRYSHVRIEFDGVLQFLSTGMSGYMLRFFDSDDFAGEHFEDSIPPVSDQMPAWLNRCGKRANLVVEDLTGSNGATLVLHECTGGNHVFRITTFIHLTPAGGIASWGPYQTSMEPTHAVKGHDDVVFEMNDSCWQGWNSCQSSSAHPIVRVSLRGGNAHSCNGHLSESEISAIFSLVDDDPDHADILFRMGVLDLIYHGHIDRAQRFVRETQLLPDFHARAAWWKDLIRQFRRSDFYDMLEKDFPQLKDADELK